MLLVQIRMKCAIIAFFECLPCDARFRLLSLKFSSVLKQIFFVLVNINFVIGLEKLPKCVNVYASVIYC